MLVFTKKKKGRKHSTFCKSKSFYIPVPKENHSRDRSEAIQLSKEKCLVQLTTVQLKLSISCDYVKSQCISI